MKIEAAIAYTYTGHTNSIYTLCKYNHNQYISAGSDGKVVAWNIDDACVATVLVSVDAAIYTMAYDEKHQLLLVGLIDGRVIGFRLIDKIKIFETKLSQRSIFSILILNNSILCGDESGCISIIDFKGIIIEQNKISEKSIRQIIKFNTEFIAASSDGRFYYLNQQLQIIKFVLAHNSSIFSIAYHKYSNHILTGSRDAYLALWDLDGLELHRAPAHLFTINAIQCHKTSPLIATASRDKTVKIWEIQDDTLLLLKVLDISKFAAHTHSVNQVLWYDHHRLLSCSDDKKIIQWKIHNI